MPFWKPEQPDNNTRIWELAKAELGTREIRGRDHNPKVLEYYREAGVPQAADEVPWCAAFVGAILKRAGLPSSGSLLARSYSQYGNRVQLKDALPGDIVVLSRGEPWQGHVGFYAGHDSSTITLLGGNQNNEVNYTKYGLNRIVEIRRA